MKNAATSEGPWVHPFQRAGLGAAPFRCIGYSKEVFQAAPGAPLQCGTSCDYCSTGIMHTYRIMSADGQCFRVGSDCVTRTGDTKLIEELRSEERAWQRAQERAAWEAGAPERARVAMDLEAKRLAQAAVNARDAAMIIEGCRVALEWCGLSEFDRSVIGAIHRELTSGSRPAGVAVDISKSSKIDEWTTLSIAYRAATLPTVGHIGSIGARIRGLVCTYEGGPTIGLDSQWGPSVLAKFRVTEGPHSGAVLVWKTGHHPAKKGATVRLTATVKDHSEYNGTTQTIVTRGKLEDL